MRIRLLLLLHLFWLTFACGLSRASDLALVGGKVYTSPTEEPIDNGSIIVRDGRILAVGPSATINPARCEGD